MRGRERIVPINQNILFPIPRYPTAQVKISNEFYQQQICSKTDATLNNPNEHANQTELQNSLIYELLLTFYNFAFFYISWL